MPESTGVGTTYLPSEEELAAMEADLAAQEQVPPPSTNLAPAGTPPPPTATVNYPTATGAGYQTPAPETQDGTYGQAIQPAPVYGDPAPAPAPPPEAVAPPPAGDPYAMDQPAPATGPLADEQYANSQRVAEFQTQQAPVAPPSLLKSEQAVGTYLPASMSSAVHAGETVPPPPRPPASQQPLYLQQSSASPMPYAHGLANPALIGAGGPQPVGPTSLLPPRPGTPGTGASLAAPFDPAVAFPPGGSMESSLDKARRPNGRPLGPANDGQTVIDQALGNVLPSIANVLTPQWGGRIGESVLAAQDAVGGMVLGDGSKPTTPSGAAGRRAGQTVDPLVDRAAQGLADAVGGFSRYAAPGMPKAPEGLPIPAPPPASRPAWQAPASPPTYEPGKGDIRSQAAAQESSAPPEPSIGDRLGGWLSQNVVDPLVKNSADETVFGVDFSKAAGMPAPANASPGWKTVGPNWGRSADPAAVPTPGQVAPAQAAPAQTAPAKAPSSARPAGAANSKPDSKGVTYIINAKNPKEAYGVVNENGEDEIFPDDWTPEQIKSRISEVSAALAAKGVVAAPGTAADPATAAVTPPATTDTGTGTNTTNTTNGSSGGSGSKGEWTDWSNGNGSSGGSGSSKTSYGGTSRSGRTSSAGSGSSDAEEYTADDFMKKAGGDRTKATAMAKAANAKRRRTKKTRGTTTTGSGKTGTFPSRAPTPLRTQILAALNESMNKGKGR